MSDSRLTIRVWHFDAETGRRTEIPAVRFDLARHHDQDPLHLSDWPPCRCPLHGGGVPLAGP